VQLILNLYKIFQPSFFTKSKGSGLELAISQKIMEPHQGEISIESHPNQGTRVTLFLKQGLSVKNQTLVNNCYTQKSISIPKTFHLQTISAFFHRPLIMRPSGKLCRSRVPYRAWAHHYRAVLAYGP
jgi:hypothetical protein